MRSPAFAALGPRPMYPSSVMKRYLPSQKRRTWEVYSPSSVATSVSSATSVSWELRMLNKTFCFVENPALIFEEAQLDPQNNFHTVIDNRHQVYCHY